MLRSMCQTGVVLMKASAPSPRSPAVRTILNLLTAALQLLYLTVTPLIAWWKWGFVGLSLWAVVTAAWIGGSVVVWSAYQQWRSQRRSTASLVARTLASPLLGLGWTFAVAACGLRLALCRTEASRAL